MCRKQYLTLAITTTAIVALMAACGERAASTPSPVAPTPTTTPAPATSTPVPPTRTPTAAAEPSPTLEPTIAATATPGDELAQAIATLRQLNPEETVDEEQWTAIETAVETIASAGPDGASRLKEALQAGEAAGEENKFFSFLAAMLLWKISGLDEAESIATIWSAVPPEDWPDYELLFFPAMEAAATQDERALPMLKALLADNQGSLFLEEHVTLAYPYTDEFLWGSYGSKALPILFEVLQTSDDPVAAATAITLLSRAQYLPALPDIRKAAESEDTDLRHAALVALGVFGHPDDFDMLLSGLDSNDPAELAKYAYALVEYGDVSATPRLIPLLQSDDKEVTQFVAWELWHSLLTPDALAALRTCGDSAANEVLKGDCARFTQAVLDGIGVTWEEFTTRPVEEQEDLLAAFRNAEYILKADERAVTRDELLQVVAEWEETGQLGSQKWDWVEARHFLPAATADDIDMLLDAKAGFYQRLSEEVIYETIVVNDLIKWLGRSRYRPMELPTPLPVTPAPAPTAKPASPPVSVLSPLTRQDAEQLAIDAMSEVGGVSLVIPMAFREEVLTISYHTETSAGSEPDAFQAQLRAAIFAAVPGFVRAEPAYETLVVWPLPPDGYGRVTISRQAALDWYTGKLNDADFKATWTIE